MTIDFVTIQKQFEDVHNQGGIPTSVTIAEVDYDAFFESLYPKREWTIFEVDLLGKEHTAEFDAHREKCKRDLTGIVNYVNGGTVRFVRDPLAKSGTFGMEWIDA